VKAHKGPSSKVCMLVGGVVQASGKSGGGA
jgi:hypothetical protein